MADAQQLKLVQAGLSPTGLSVVIFAGLTLLVGIGLSNGTLIAISSIVILLLSLAIIPGRKAADSLRFEIALPKRVRADRPFPLLINIHNTSRLLPTPPLHASLAFPNAPSLNFDAESLPPLGESRLRLKSRNLARGVYNKWTILVESGFPMGLFSFRYQGEINRAIRVIPRAIAPDRAEEFGNDRLSDTTPLSGQSGEEEEFVALRPYRNGDSLRRIHWPTSNRGRGLIIREVEFPGQLPSHITVIFHSVNPSSLIRPDRFERALSQLTGILESLVKANRKVEIRADFDNYQARRIRQTHQLRAYLDSLAEISRRENSPASQLQQNLDQIPDSHHLIVISDVG